MLRKILSMQNAGPSESAVVAADDDAIRVLVKRLARPHASGGDAIERSVILAEGSNSAAIIDWILAHSGVGDSTAVTASRHGLHGPREQAGLSASSPRPPLRFVLPAGSLD
jgi:hypothetical protein